MNLSPLPIQKFFDNNGRPLAGGLLFTYEAGTSIKIATYKDRDGSQQNTNPIDLDFRGECRVWLDIEKTYKFVLCPPGDTDPPGNPIWTADNVAAPFTLVDLTQQLIGRILFPRTQAEIDALVTPTDYAFRGAPIIEAERYGLVVDGTTNEIPVLNRAFAVAQALGGAIVQLPPGTIAVSEDIDVPSGVWLRGSGRDVTIIKNLNTQNINVIQIGRNVEFAAVTDLTVDGNGDASFAVQGIGCNDIRYCRIERVRVKNCGTTSRSGNIMSVVAHDGETFQTEGNVFRDIILNDDNDAVEFGLRVYWGVSGGTPTNFVRRNLFENITINGCNKNGIECTGRGIQQNTFRSIIVRDTGMWSSPFEFSFGASYNLAEDIQVINFNQPHTPYPGTLTNNRKCFCDTGYDSSEHSIGNMWRNLRVNGFEALNTGTATVFYQADSTDCTLDDLKAYNVSLGSSNSMRMLGQDGQVHRAKLSKCYGEGEFSDGQVFADEVHNCEFVDVMVRSTASMDGIRSFNAAFDITDCEWRGCWFINTGSAGEFGCNLNANSARIKFIGGGFKNFSEYGIRSQGTAVSWLITGVTFSDITGGVGRGIFPSTTGVWVIGPNIFDNVTTPVFHDTAVRKVVTPQGAGTGIQMYGSGAPSSGTYNVGDIVWATSPTAGGNIGWVCTAAGTPGTWKTFGSIAA